jgi:hypothetical protein
MHKKQCPCFSVSSCARNRIEQAMKYPYHIISRFFKYFYFDLHEFFCAPPKRNERNILQREQQASAFRLVFFALFPGINYESK